MANRLSLLLCLAIIISFLGGCSSTSHKIPGAVLTVQSLPTSASLEVLGPVEGEASATYLFGFIRIGGSAKSGAVVAPTGGSMLSGGNRVLNAAVFDAIEKVPEADYLIAPRWREETKNYYLWITRKVHVRGKAVRINPSGN